MKTLAYLVVLMGITLFVQPMETQASDYLGDICFTGSSSQSTSTFTLRLGISSVGGGHYALHGLIATPTSLGAAVNGSLEMRSDGSIVASLSYASKDDTHMWGRTMRLYFGSEGNIYHNIGAYKEFGQPGTTGYYDNGTITLTPCQ